MSQLAIVIPAYKDSFLKDTLESIAAQTCKDFTLYIGDDCSPYNLSEIVDAYKGRINLVYHRFDTNIGGKDLVAQWTRCINLIQDEPYIWLFSDDDVMEPHCVESFIKLPEKTKQDYLIHFNISVIDEFNSGILESKRKYPQFLSAKKYLDSKLCLHGQKGLVSYVVEFVFSRDLYNRAKGFQNFDLAWGSDFLTWLKMASICKGIYTIDSDKSQVLWRRSSVNISPNKSKPILIRKIKSQIKNAAFIQDILAQNGLKRNFMYAKFVWGVIKKERNNLTKEDKKELYQEFVKEVGFPFWSALSYFLVK